MELFITILTTAHHWILSWARQTQSTHTHNLFIEVPFLYYPVTYA